MKRCKSVLLFTFLFLTMFLSVNAQAQMRLIKGLVLDESKQPLVGASVVVKGGGNRGVITDLNGGYELKAKKGEVLEFSFMGYVTKSVTVGDSNQIDVDLVPNSTALSGTVVTALGIKRSEKTLSYNVQKVNSDALTKVKDANFVNSLNGKVAGVLITKSSSGVGGATSVIMRGTKSISGNNNVLYVVDGMPISNQNIAGDGSEYGRPGGGEGISDFNSDDIESISVLTGPSAAALYGASAANGVIIINTKKGSKGALKVNFSSNTEMLKAGIMPEFQNTYSRSEGTYLSWGPKMDKPSTFNPRDFFQTGFSTINSVNISGGSEQSQTFVSIASTDSKGIIPNNAYYKYNFGGRNTSNFLNNKLHLDLGANYVLQGDQNMMSGGRYFNPLRPLYLFPPSESFEEVMIYERYDINRQINTQYWPYGTQGEDFENPYWIVNREMFTNKKERYMYNVRAQYDIFDWMNVAGRVRVDNTYTSRYVRFFATTNPLFTGDKSLETAKGSFSRSEEKYAQTYADLMLNINKKWDKLSFNANIGASFDDRHATGTSVGGRLKSIPNLFSTPNVDTENGSGGGESRSWTRNIATFGSAELGYKNYLFLTATLRSDWASQLVSNGKTPAIIYPSVGLSGVISDMVNLPKFISFLKLRASFTEVGSPIQYQGITPGTVTYGMEKGLVKPISTYPYPDFKPERTRSWEAGVNAKLFDGKFHIDATIYQSNTYNQTFVQNMSASSGFSGFYVQAGDIRNRGIEMAVGYDNTWGDWALNSNLTFTRNVNKVMELVKDYTNPIDGTKFDINVLTSPKYMRPGDSMNDIFTQGILIKGKDGRLVEEGDGFKIDKTQRLKIGSTAPSCLMGWNNTISFKGLDLSFLISARLGGNVTSATQAMMDGFGVSKVSADARDKGGVMVDGQLYDAKRYYTTIGLNRLSAYYLYDATNIKLQELSLGYTFPKKWFKKGIKTLSLALIGRNLVSIYRAAPYDTDMSGGTGTYSVGGDNFMPPSMRSIGFNIKLGL